MALEWGIWPSLTLENPDLSVFDYNQAPPDLTLITFQFSWVIIPSGPPRPGPIQSAKTAKEAFVTSEVQCSSYFGLRQECKGHWAGYITAIIVKASCHNRTLETWPLCSSENQVLYVIDLQGWGKRLLTYPASMFKSYLHFLIHFGWTW